MTNGYDSGPHVNSPADPAPDVRAEMERSVADVSPLTDLLSAAHLRAHRLRRRRRVAGGVAISLGATALIGAGALVPALASRPDPPAVGAPSAPVTPLTTPVQGPDRTPTRPPSTGPRSPRDTGEASSRWGVTTIDDAFGRPPLDRALWNVYDGPGDALGRWSPSDVAVHDGALRLTVSRTGGSPPSSWGGVGALGSAQRYGRWEVRLRMSVGRGVIGQFVLSPVPGTATDPSPVLVVSLSPYHGVVSVSGSGTGRGGPRSFALRRPGDYHVVAVEWTPERVRVLLDGATLAGWTDGRLPVPLWPAVQTIMAGPDCGSTPLPADCQGTTTSFPQRLDVDWIRARALRG